MSIKIGLSEEAGDGCEWVWAEDLGSNQARLKNLPAINVSFAYMDVVEYDSDSMEVTGKVEEGPYRTAVVVYPTYEEGRDVTQARLSKLVGMLWAYGMPVQGQMAGLASVAVPYQISAYAFSDMLSRLPGDYTLAASGLNTTPDRGPTLDEVEDLLVNSASDRPEDEATRLDRVFEISEAYARGTGLDGGDAMGTALSDLLADMRHLCRVAEIPFRDLLRRSEMHYQEESEGK